MCRRDDEENFVAYIKVTVPNIVFVPNIHIFFFNE